MSISRAARSTRARRCCRRHSRLSPRLEERNISCKSPSCSSRRKEAPSCSALCLAEKYGASLRRLLRGPDLCQQVVYELSLDIGEAEIAALEAKCQFGVIETQQM